MKRDERMFRLSKNKASSKSAADTRFEYPRDGKLLVSVVSVESGKAIAKSSKVLVQNGSCQWDHEGLVSLERSLLIWQVINLDGCVTVVGYARI
ncbi:hypothetical protein HN51_023970 [Arachis hypogaea]